MVEGALEKLPTSRSASSKLENVVEQLDFVQDMSRQVIDESSDVPRIIDGIKFTIRNIALPMEELKRELAKREAP